MPSKRCYGDHRRNRLPPPLPMSYRSPNSALRAAELRKVDWNSIQLPPIEKNLYQEHPNTAKRPYAAVRDYLRGNWITVTAGHVAIPKPILRLEEANFPRCVADGARAVRQDAPSPIEAQCWPIALSGKDLLAVTPASGSSKVLAYLLPAIAHVRQQPAQQGDLGPMALVLAPTRELTEQIHQVAKQLEPHSGVRSVCLVGGRPKEPQLKELRDGFGICVATPRRLLNFLEESELNLLRCTYLVLDDTDRMLLVGVEADALAVIDQIRPDRQTLVFTTSWVADVRAFALPLLRDYVEASFVAPEPCKSYRVECVAHICDANEKDDVLMKLLEESFNEGLLKVVVIANVSWTIDDLVTKIAKRGWVAVGLYGKKTPEERGWVVNAFRSGTARVLVGTPAAMHDLVLEGVRIVVNFDVAETSKEYCLRMRHAASSGEAGEMHTLIGPEDSGRAKELISFLRDTNQKVDPELVRVVKDGIRSPKIEQGSSSPKDIPANHDGS